MARVLDWSPTVPREMARLLARSLRGGWLLAMPTEADYALACWARSEQAVERLRQLAGGRPALAVASGTAAGDWARFNAPGRRLAERLWPGPLTLACTEGLAEGLASRLPAVAREAACERGELHLRASAHEAPAETLRWLAGPLLLAPLPAGPATGRERLAGLGERVDLIVDDGPGLGQPPTVVRLSGDEWTVAQPGTLAEAALHECLARRIVFVCTGNTCRSPLAEAICKQRLAERLGCSPAELPARGFVVRSAGLAAAAGMPAAEEAIEVARALGAADLLAHYSQPLSADLARGADLILAMTRGHLAALEHYFPEAVARLLSPEGDDVADPIGQPLEVYEACARQMAAYIDALIAELFR